ncbi:MAG: hypothetical protein AB1499_03740 [Nitrospirota bacterium]
MSDRKSGDDRTVTERQTVVHHNRRMEEVRKNFAVGMQRIIGGRVFNNGHHLKSERRNTA